MVLAQVVVKEEAGGAEALSTNDIIVNIQSPFKKTSLISLNIFFGFLLNLTFSSNSIRILISNNQCTKEAVLNVSL